ncbi:MAG: tetratricopeptide repeat protein [Bryobacteraceae bacterium]|nr:tetratricopeptide repeat protein [Bryobacteraceae bacterium]
MLLVLALTFAQDLLQQATAAHQRGDLAAARQGYQQYLATHPGSLEAQSNVGAVHAQLAEYPQAIAAYRKALTLQRGNPRVRLNLALAYLKRSELEPAIRQLFVVRAIEPANQQALLLLADSFLRLGAHREVIRLLENQPAEPAVTYLLGTALIRSGEVERGQVVIDTLLKQGESAETLLLIGSAQLTTGAYKDALATLERAVALNPRIAALQSQYGIALLSTGEAPRAMAAFRAALALDADDFDANVNLAGQLRLAKELGEARRYVDRASRIRPNSPAVRYQAGALALAEGQADAARSTLEAVVAASPNFLEAHVALATAYYRLNRKADGDRVRATIERLNAQAQKRELEPKP